MLHWSHVGPIALTDLAEVLLVQLHELHDVVPEAVALDLSPRDNGFAERRECSHCPL